MFCLFSSKLLMVLHKSQEDSTLHRQGIGESRNSFLGACSPCRADHWLLGQKDMLQRGGVAGSTPSTQGLGTGMSWAPLSHSLSLPCWESHWPETQAEQPQMQHISMPCLSFPIATTVWVLASPLPSRGTAARVPGTRSVCNQGGLSFLRTDEVGMRIAISPLKRPIKLLFLIPRLGSSP